MAAYRNCFFVFTVLILSRGKIDSKKDQRGFFTRRNLQQSWTEKREKRAITSTTKDKETNKLILAALYGGLGIGVPSAQNFDYAKGLDPKIQAAGGYGLPPGIYSYAFDPKTGMPFMCDPTKTPPGALTSQTAALAANSPNAVNKLAADATPKIQPPKYHLSPVGKIMLSGTAQNDGPRVPGLTTSSPENDDTTPSQSAGNDLMTSSSPSDQHNDITPTSSHEKTMSSKDARGKSSSTTLALQSKAHGVGYGVISNVNNHKQSRTRSRPLFGHLVGIPLYVDKPKTNSHEKSHSSFENKLKAQRLLMDNLKLQDEKKLSTMKLEGKQSNHLKEHMKSEKVQKVLKKGEITIQLPEIPPCPDMKQYHWPWNCLEKGEAARRECIEKYGSQTYSYHGESFPYGNYEQLVYY